MTTTRKKMIEVALPLEAINVASAKEKSIRHGHPSTLHLWWARRPLAACRAVLFGSLVDDSSSWPEKFPTEDDQEVERQRLFRIIEELVKWENSNNESVLNAARAEIARSIAWNKGEPAPTKPKEVQDYLNNNAPPVLDPFCGGGSIPLEAQRLGLEAHGSDLNPVAVLITKALIEIPPKFADRPPVNPEAQKKLDHSAGWKGTQGLAEDVRYYGRWIRDQAESRIGHLYPRVKLTSGSEATVIAWLWARTVRCPNPACGIEMPLVRGFLLSTKKGKEAWVEPDLNKGAQAVTFNVRLGKPPSGVTIHTEATIDRRGARCVICRSSVPLDYIRSEGKAGRMNAQLLAIVAQGSQDRIYVSPADFHEKISNEAQPSWKPETPLPPNTRDIRPQLYGMPTYGDLFTARQLVALETFSSLVGEAHNKIQEDLRAISGNDSNESLAVGKTYADAVATYLALGVSRLSDICNSLCRWEMSKTQVRNLFNRQAVPMIWDFAEPNIFAHAAGDFGVSLGNLIRALESTPARGRGIVRQLDATAALDPIARPLISTDPPYYDNISYSDLSDFFYVWLRRSLKSIYPDIFSTLLVPRAQELVAMPYRFNGNGETAKAFFEEGLSKVFGRIVDSHNPDYPVSVYYAFKQTEEEPQDESMDARVASTGWESMLEGLISTGFSITGTWPMRTELANRSVSLGANALASSIILVCRRLKANAPLATRREFLSALKRELPDALKKLQHGNIAPVDLAQAAIGPGMAVFSRYSRVVESDGSPMRVRAALQLINQSLDEVLAAQDSEYDSETRCAIAWFEQFGMEDGGFGQADVLARAKNTSVSGMDEAGVTISRAGKVRLLRRDELSDEWDPAADKRLTVWEVVQYLIRELETEGEAAAAKLFTKVGGLAEVARDLAYRLYTTSERKAWTQEALAYNSLVVAWPEIKRLAATPATQTSGTLFDESSGSE